MVTAEKRVDDLKQQLYFQNKQINPDDSTAMKAITSTYNNFGCLHKKLNNLKTAVKYLKNVLEIETQMSAEIKNFELSSTYINICTIYSEMKKHDIALSYIRKAIKFLEEDFEERLHAMDEREKKQFLQIFATAYHNAAVEFEYLQENARCMEFYNKAYAIANDHLGPDNPLSQAFLKSL